MKPRFQTKQAFTHTPLNMIIFHSKNSKVLNQEHWFSSDNSFTATNTLLCGLIWLIFRLFSTKAFVAWFTAQKQLWCHSVFYIATSSVQSWRHALFCFLLLLTEDTHNHKLARAHTHTHHYVPSGHWGLSPPSSLNEDEQCSYCKSTKIRIHNLTMTPWRIKEGHNAKTGSLITIQCTLGTLISPGALKDWAKHLKR